MTKDQLIIGKNTNCLFFDQKLETSLISFFNSFESKLTSQEYLRASRDFLSFVAPAIKDVNELERDHLIMFQAQLRDEGNSRKTILKKMSAVSSLCKHLAHKGLVEKDLSYGLQLPKSTNKKETADFTDEEVKKIFAALDPRKYSYTSHRAILAIGFYTGLRSSEIRNLKVSNISELKGHRVLTLVIKGSKPHEVPLSPFCYYTIAEHISRLVELGFDIISSDQLLFPCLKPLRNKPISRAGLSKILKMRMKDPGIVPSSARRYSPHSMRATLASHLLNVSNAPLDKVQQVLGHSSPTTTAQYNKRELEHCNSPLYNVSY